MEDRTIFITEGDFKRLRHLLELGRGCLPGHRQHLELLEQDLDRARVVPSRDLPEYLSIISSQLWVQDLSSRLEAPFMLVFPRDADSARRRISILAPMGLPLIPNWTAFLLRFRNSLSCYRTRWRRTRSNLPVRRRKEAR